MARVVAMYGPCRGVARDVDGGLLVGRTGEAGLQLLDDKVSREHCRFEASPDGVRVTDLGSRNGTWVNGERIAAVTRLAAGDRVSVGETVLVFEPSFDAVLARDGSSTVILSRRPCQDVSQAPAPDGEALARAGALALEAALATVPEEAAARLCEALRHALSPLAVVVLLRRPSGLSALVGQPAGCHVNVSGPLVERALREGRPLAMAEEQPEAHIDSEATRVSLRAGHLLCAPFGAGPGGGAVCVVRARPFSAAELTLAGALTQAVGPSLRLAAAATAPVDDAPVAESAAMREALRVATAAAQVSSTVLITGETGTGKEELARAVHFRGPRGRGPFVALNCGAIPSELAESELFGHEKGAFTGALAPREGVFEQADGGTLFLDEIGELPLPLQVKLLRVLQDRRVTRVGGKASIPVDVRIVAATHRDLDRAAADGAFRQDLLWRLKVLPIHLPPLRERPEDVLPLAERFLSRLSRELGKPPEGFTPEARRALTAYAWPGNARQLANALERALVVRQTAGPLGLLDLPAELLQTPAKAVGKPAGALGDMVRALEREQIVLALKRAQGVKVAAAEALGISRPTLDRKIDEYDIRLFE